MLTNSTNLRSTRYWQSVKPSQTQASLGCLGEFRRVGHFRQRGNHPEGTDVIPTADSRLCEDGQHLTDMKGTKANKMPKIAGLALFAILAGVALTHPSDYSQLDAATGVIDVLNVGTCFATDADVFDDESCALFNAADDWEIRDRITEAKTVYATYAHDPKTAWDEPRAILEDSDLLKISIRDPGRDRRSGVLVYGNGHANLGDDGLNIIRTSLRDDRVLSAAAAADLRFESNGATLDNRDNADDRAVINSSGNYTFIIAGASSYKPMDINGKIRFFGCITGEAACDPASSNNDALSDITSSLRVDEDRSAGSINPNIGPWLAINAGVPADVDIIIYAIYYETSDQEDLVGGLAYCDERLESDGTCPNPNANLNDHSGIVAFTEDEVEENDALLAQVTSDGNVQSSNLHLTETGLFTGTYQGFVRLTDPNGDGSTSTSQSSTDWGYRIRDGSNARVSGSAVVAVESGPVTVEYRDSSGRVRTLRIEIDHRPPVVTIDSPRHNDTTDDISPEFLGSFEDGDAGLANDSFRLVVDNEEDRGLNSDYALDGIAPEANVRSVRSDGIVTRRADYTGFTSSGDDPFGVVDPKRLYRLGDEGCRKNDICHIRSDRYRDGALRGTFDDSVRLDLDHDEVALRVDFQAFVADNAGNIGFSDSNPYEPQYINDLGESRSSQRFVPNVLGSLSAHIFSLDETAPVFRSEHSSTGFYGVNDDDLLIVNRHGLMVVFDGPIDPDTVSLRTFDVELDDGDEAEVVDALVEGNRVFLKLRHELASDATPIVSLAPGARVEDLAGNSTSSRQLGKIELSDGMLPKLKVTLEGGSGIGEGQEGPSRLTNRHMTIRVSSDEPLRGSPRIFVVCKDLSWIDRSVSGRIDFDLDDFIANRHGIFATQPQEPPGTEYTCGYDRDGDRNPDRFQLTEAIGLSRPGENWEYTWQNPSSGDSRLMDGELAVVVMGRDRSTHFIDGVRAQNWSVGTGEFNYDTTFISPTRSAGGNVHPVNNSRTSEQRPFVLIDFNETSAVKLQYVEFDGEVVTDQFEEVGDNRFSYWPLSTNRGIHEVEVVATDAAGNEVEFDFKFESTERGDFVVDLISGWNAISFPAHPLDASVAGVFTDPAVEAVIGWDTQGWRISVRRGDTWVAGGRFGGLNEIRAGYAYWVKSSSITKQRVQLIPRHFRSDASVPRLSDIQVKAGWNFVGVVDVSGEQSEDHFGVTLVDSERNPVTAGEYLGRYVRAYTWDPIYSRLTALRPDQPMTVGDGVWVFYPRGEDIAP